MSQCCEPKRHSPEAAAGLNVLDSRAIGRASCFAQRFMRPGSYPYAIVPGYGQAIASDHAFVIDVSGEKRDDMEQHNVLVSQSDKGFDVDRPQLSVRTGDLVLWSGDGRTTTSFAIVGQQEFFSSHRMVNECGYSHAFGIAGEYQWEDAFGSGMSGRIHVDAPQSGEAKGFARWQRQLQQGTVVMIQDGRVEPAEVKIVVGQRIFFAVVTSRGVSITDSRLLEVSRHRGQNASEATS
jgi:plastocyanin